MGTGAGHRPDVSVAGMTFGFETPVDLLSWSAALLVGIKALATVILLARAPARRLSGAYGVPLWWATKITPILAVPCLIAIATIQRNTGELWAYSALMLFVLVMVPVMVWIRFYRKPAA